MGKLYKSLPDFLGEELRDALLEYSLANEERFEPTTIGIGVGRQDPTYRVSSRLKDLGPLERIIGDRVSALFPKLVEELGITPFHPSGLEMEIVAHGDGAFYKRHIDLFSGSSRASAGEDRLLTLVYYFYREPKAFSGGALRLYPLAGAAGADKETGIDVQIEQDTAVAFSSWLPHEVLNVRCPSGKFADFRFAVNCWVLKARKAAGT